MATKRSTGPTKGSRTRQRIVEEAAALFNTRGFAGASMADVSLATGLEKGGVYNHFASKDDLSVAAFEYAAGLVRDRLEQANRSGSTPIARLRAIVEIYGDAAERPFLAGGCPILNTAVEFDDTDPGMRRRVRASVDHWRSLLESALEDAIAAGELRSVDPAAFASVAVGAMEGGVMLSRLYRDRQHMEAVVAHLHAWIDSLRPRHTRGAATR